MAISSIGSSGGMNLNYLNDTVYKGIQAHENKLRDTLSRIGNADGSVSQADMLKMQQEVQQWTMMVDVHSTIAKQISDLLKGIVQKAT